MKNINILIIGGSIILASMIGVTYLTVTGEISLESAPIKEIIETNESDIQETQEEIVEVIEEVEEIEVKEDNFIPFTGLPTWATEFGITEPQGLILNLEESYIGEDDGYTPNSVKTIYTGNLDLLMSESRRITDELNLDVIIDDELSTLFSAEGIIENSDLEVSISVYNATLTLAIMNIGQEEMYR